MMRGARGSGRSGRSSRAWRQVTLATALVFGFTVMVPAGVPTSEVGLPVSWLWSWARPDRAAAQDPSIGGIPKQWSGTAEGKEHYVSGTATAAKGGNGLPPGKGI